MDTLEYWENIRDQRIDDISLELLRDEDHELVRLLKESLHIALEKIEELTDV